MAHFKIKQIGNHWYPSIRHEYNTDISLDPKIERYLTVLSNKFYTDEFNIELEEIPMVIEECNLIYFDESDITRYYTTDDRFNLQFEVNGHTFEINDYLFSCFEDQFNLNFHENLYKIHIW